MFFISAFFLWLNPKRLFIGFLVFCRNFDNESQQPANYDTSWAVQGGTVCQRACEHPSCDLCHHFNLISWEFCDVGLVFSIRPGFADCGASSNFTNRVVFGKFWLFTNFLVRCSCHQQRNLGQEPVLFTSVSPESGDRSGDGPQQELEHCRPANEGEELCRSFGAGESCVIVKRWADVELRNC